MQIHGLQKMTLLAYPGKVACTVFIAGCNYACPYCHNSQLQTREAEPIMQDDALLSFLQKRQCLLDGVCITGGEPTLNPELPRLLARIKALGYAVKLDTNGSRPEVLRQLVTAGLVDYVVTDGTAVLGLGDIGRIHFIDWDQTRGRTRTVQVMILGE